jgi:hypothetical protein
VTKKSTEPVAASSPTWKALEAFARQSMQQFLQRVLEEEVEGLLARGRYKRRAAVDAPELLAEVANGVAYVNGVRAVSRGEQKAAA